jgi:flagellar biosynthesis protein FlhF
MKIRRFFAADMRQALRQVRESLGSDAVILSNKGVEGGVELVAAVDYDESAFSAPQSEAYVEKPVSMNSSDKRIKASKIDQHADADPLDNSKTESPSRHRYQTPPQVEWSQDPVLREMRREMQAMRRMMENELSELTWRDLGQRRPQTQELLRRLIGLGLDAAHCRELAYRVEDAESPEQAWRQSLSHLMRELPIGSSDLLDQGGTIALIGPTGVGKTTTIAKLAAKFCLRHGNRHLALISTDSYRIGAQEQLHNYGHILDVPVRNAATADDLSRALHAFADKRLVLIDTAGMGLKDRKLTERLALMTSGSHPIKTLLTLSATTQRTALTRAVEAFAGAKPVGAVITKTDEAAELGGIFSGLIEARLPLAFVTDGQRVPEDIRVASAIKLVSQAIELSGSAEITPDEEYLAMAFGGMGEHAHV